MASEGIHKLIKRHDSIGHEGLGHKWELCLTSSDPVDGFYIGNWIEGMGLVNVLFPVESTRDLTSDEIEFFSGKRYKLADHPSVGLDVTKTYEDDIDADQAKGIIEDVLDPTESVS